MNVELIEEILQEFVDNMHDAMHAGKYEDEAPAPEMDAMGDAMSEEEMGEGESTTNPPKAAADEDVASVFKQIRGGDGLPNREGAALAIPGARKPPSKGFPARKRA